VYLRIRGGMSTRSPEAYVFFKNGVNFKKLKKPGRLGNSVLGGCLGFSSKPLRQFELVSKSVFPPRPKG